MQKTVQLYIIPRERVPVGPPGPPESLDIEAAGIDEVRSAVRREVEGRGLVLRSVSSTATGLVAYAEQKA